jgi:D-amino-acid oxidase
MDLVVIGAGVNGLTTGICLLEAGYAVRIYARELPPETTSNVAAAIWYPYRAEPRRRVEDWGRVALERFRDLAALPESGVSTITGCELFDEPAADPWWRSLVADFRRAAPEELPSGYADAYIFTAPLIDTSLYMPYLLHRFRSSGGSIEQRAIDRLADLCGPGRIVVNCAGLGARELADDASVYATRGQIVRTGPISLDRILLDQHGHNRLTYVVPRRDDCILGGTAEEQDERREVDAATAREIVRKCALLAPSVREAEVWGHAVGLRPCRPEIRLETECAPEGGAVVHNYGHGGAGVTLSWGCAAEVVARVIETGGAGGRRDPPT